MPAINAIKFRFTRFIPLATIARAFAVESANADHNLLQACLHVAGPICQAQAVGVPVDWSEKVTSNGTQPEIADNFFGIAGCNGTISFRFSTPIYLWLLENM